MRWKICDDMSRKWLIIAIFNTICWHSKLHGAFNENGDENFSDHKYDNNYPLIDQMYIGFYGHIKCERFYEPSSAHFIGSS